MRADELDLRELLEFCTAGGVIRFAGERALLLDAAALGLLRKELIEALGMSAARGILTRHGYAHGWRTAEALKDAYPWDDPGEWRRAGGRLHALQGIVVVETLPDEDELGRPVGGGLWHDSYEAEQHLLHLGQADEPVCWTLTGFASGYMSCCYGEDVFAVETRCVGRGDAVCRLSVRPREAWGEAIEAHLPYYEKGCLDVALRQLTEDLKRAERRLRSRRRQLGTVPDGPGLIARSTQMRELVSLAQRAARVDTTVLVTGESGVGKERIARLVHESSPRAGGPFLAINCGAISESLIESELFGHAQGAFTGATRERTGLFEAAQGGTLFLDEVGELPPATQVKLLRVLQEREVRRVGENTPRAVDARLLAATNVDLQRAAETGRFRQDLLYRLKVIELPIPPLRERPDDVLPLARAFLLETAPRMGRKVTGFTPPAADQLLRYDWPGNVRELQNAIERALVVGTGTRIAATDLPEEVRQARARGVSPSGGGRTLAEIEREVIMAGLERHAGHRGRVAAELGIGIATLYRKLKRYQAE